MIPLEKCRDRIVLGTSLRIGGLELFFQEIFAADAGMLAAACKDGAHRTYMDQHKAGSMFDRSPLTRLRLLASRGSRDGVDPLAEAA